MKGWASSWTASIQRRKQRKYRHGAPLHVLKKFVRSQLSKELRKKYNTRSLGLRVGDKVKIMRGQFKGQNAKVETINLQRGRITLAGMNLPKKDGTKVPFTFNASNLQITEIKVDDKQRSKILERKK